MPLVALLAPSPAVTAAELREGIWTVSPTVASHYVFRGVKLAGASFQPWVEYNAGPLSAGIWSSASLHGRSFRDADPEVDLYGSYAFSAASGAFSIVPGFYWYTYPAVKDEDHRHAMTFEPSLGVVFTWAGVQFTPKIYYDTVLKGATGEINAAIAVPLKSWGTELDFSASAGTYKWSNVARHESPRVKNWGDYWSVGVAVPVQITMHSKLTAAVTYSEGSNNFFKSGTAPREANADAHGQTFATLSYSFTF